MSTQKRIEDLERQLAEKTRAHDGVVLQLESLREIVTLGWRFRREPCPFCQQLFRHRDTCYLNAGASDTILAEYAEIERQRDRLLARLQSLQDHPELNPVRSLKTRLRKPPRN